MVKVSVSKENRYLADVAQLVEQRFRKAQVVCSSHIIGSILGINLSK